MNEVYTESTPQTNIAPTVVPPAPAAANIAYVRRLLRGAGVARRVIDVFSEPTAPRIVYASVEPMTQQEARTWEQALQEAAVYEGRFASVGACEMFGTVRTLRFEVSE